MGFLLSRALRRVDAPVVSTSNVPPCRLGAAFVILASIGLVKFVDLFVC